MMSFLQEQMLGSPSFLACLYPFKLDATFVASETTPTFSLPAASWKEQAEKKMILNETNHISVQECESFLMSYLVLSLLTVSKILFPCTP